jgi:hypothetical protein
MGWIHQTAPGEHINKHLDSTKEENFLTKLSTSSFKFHLILSSQIFLQGALYRKVC